MAILDFAVYFILLIMIVISIVIGVYLSTAIGSNPNYSTNPTLVTLNWLLIASYILLIITAILLFVNLIASSFFNVSAVTNVSYGFPMWISVFSLFLLFMSFIIYVWIYFQVMGNAIANPILQMGITLSNLLLTSSILIFISFLILLFFVIYQAYHPTLIILPPIAPVVAPAIAPVVAPVLSSPSQSALSGGESSISPQIMNTEGNGQGNLFTNETPQQYVRTKRPNIM